MRRAAVILALVVVACGGGIDGEGVFARAAWEGRAGCVACHSTTVNVIVIGPSLGGIAVTAGERVPGMGAEEYIRTSILDPNAHIAPGYHEGEMPGGWHELLTIDELDALVEFLLTLD